MNKGIAKKLDDILSKIIESGGYDCDFHFNTPEELYEFEDYLSILDKDKYIIDWGADEKSCVVFISPKGRMFIKNGGYTTIVEEKERRERQRQEELQNQMLLLSKLNEPTQTVHIHTGKPDEKKSVWGYIVGIAGCLGTIDGCINGFQTLKYLTKQLLSLLHIQGF